MLIRNYGHLWQRKHIVWGRPRVKGHLIGYTGSFKADFRDQIGIYVLFGKDQKPVYIGQVGSKTQTLFNRLAAHETDHLWNRWEQFTWFGLKRVNRDGTLSLYDKPTKIFKVDGVALLNEIEAALMTAMEPNLNKQGPRWKDAEEYFQDTEQTQDITMRDLLMSHKELEDQIASLGKKLLKQKPYSDRVKG